MLLKIGSRKSELAMIQTRMISASLCKNYPDLEIKIIGILTTGDLNLDQSLSEIGDKGIFNKQLEDALLAREVDIVVHSLKDMPTTLPPHLTIGAICRRDSPYDIVVMRKDLSHIRSLSDLPANSVVGTSSVRRTAQLMRNFPHLTYKSVRGNINTRLRKLDDSEGYGFSALILAQAGIDRMNLSHRVSQVLGPSLCLNAVSQGALCIECREDDTNMLELVRPLADHRATLECSCERALLSHLQGGCSVPVGVHTTLQAGTCLTLTACVCSVDGSRQVTHTASAHICGACCVEEQVRTCARLGESTAVELLRLGAKQILADIVHA